MRWIGLSFQLQQLVIGPRRPTALREDEPPLGLGNARGKRIAQAKAKVGDQHSIFRHRDGVAGIRAGSQSRWGLLLLTDAAQLSRASLFGCCGKQERAGVAWLRALGESDDTGGLIEREGRMHDDGGRQCRPG